MYPELIIKFFVEKGLVIFYSIIVAITGAIISRIAKKLIYSFFSSKISNNSVINERKSQTLASVISSVVKYIIYFICICIILSLFGVNVTSLIAVASVGSVAVGFGAQSIVKDIFAGFFIVLEDQFGVGDIVTIEGKTGTVESISMRTTQLRAYDGTVYIIPNGNIGIITNMCKEFICAVVDVDIDYGCDIQKAINILKDEMEKCSKDMTGLREVPNVLGVINLGDSGVTVRIVAECEVKENFRIERELKLKIKERFDAEKIIIPFPQRTIHISKDVE